MTDKQLMRFADLTGMAAATTCIILSIDHVAVDGWLWPILYALGVFIVTNKINRIVRNPHD
jgi:hypothetical protein